MDDKDEKEHRDLQQKFLPEIKSKLKVIDATKFRHILEHLPEQRKANNGKPASKGSNWRSFWNSVKPDFSSKSPPDETHPFYQLWEKYSKKPREEQEEFQEAGQELYNTLSDVIHKAPKGDYELTVPDQWSTPVRDLLEALVPKPKPMDDDVIDWKAQRKRFVTGVKTQNERNLYQKKEKRRVLHFQLVIF
jgi:hypothetical protein